MKSKLPKVARPTDESKIEKKIPEPLLTIVIPVRNCAGYMMRMLNEVNAQRAACGELAERVCLVIVDDASDDETARFAAEFSQGRPWITRLAGTERIGAGGCRNRGAKFAMEVLKTAYTAFFDADDFLSQNALPTIVSVLRDGKADCVTWGFQTLNADAETNKAWIPKYKNPDEWTTCPVAPWLHAIRSHMVAPFPEQLTTDDTIWWFRQAQVLQELGAKFAFVYRPLYVYDRRTGGCTRACDYFAKHSVSLEAAAVDDVCIANRFPDRYISDCLRNLAEMYDMRNSLTGVVREEFNKRFHRDIAACMTGHWGW